MAFFDNPKALLAHLRHSFITSDDTGKHHQLYICISYRKLSISIHTIQVYTVCTSCILSSLLVSIYNKFSFLIDKGWGFDHKLSSPGGQHVGPSTPLLSLCASRCLLCISKSNCHPSTSPPPPPPHNPQSCLVIITIS